MSAYSDDARVRLLSDGDWDAVVDLELRTYAPAGLSEGRAALQARVTASPSTCFVLDLDRRLAGYALALPYPESAYPELAGTEATAFASSNLHLHDLVIAEHLRGRGLGRHLLRHLTATALARGFRRISLVAVTGSDTFWADNGFVAHGDIVASDSYGADAVYMSRAVPSGAAAKAVPAGRTVVAVAAARAAAGDPAPAGGPAPAPLRGMPPRANGTSPRGPSTQPQKG
jgi:GNAT superfamily N-acetyltransferase